MHTESKLRNHRFIDWLSNNFLLVGGALSIYVAIFAGRFSVSRVFSTFPSHWFVMGEIRTWAIITAAVLVYLGWRRCRITAISMVDLKWVWFCVGLIISAHLVLMAHSFFYSHGARQTYFVWELTTIISTAVIFGLAFQVWGVRLVNAMMRQALCFSLLLVLWMLVVTFAVNTRTEGPPLATTFSFYRIQMFGGFAAFVILFERNKIAWKVLFGLCAAICFAAAYMSLSKAAFIAGITCLLFLTAVYVTWFSKIRAGIVLSVTIFAIITFFILDAKSLVARVEVGMLDPGDPPSSFIYGSPKYQNPIDLDELTANEAQIRLADIFACTAEKYPCFYNIQRSEQLIVDALLRYHVYIPDFSVRIRLLFHGFNGIALAPWMGNGINTFNFVATTRYTSEPEIYTYPHNIVIDLLYSVGIIGFVIFGGIFFALVWLVMQAKTGVQIALPMLAYVFSVCIGSLFAGDYIDFRLAFFGILICIMLCNAEASRPVSRMVSAS